MLPVNIIAAFVVFLGAIVSTNGVSFHPSTYQKRTAICQAIKRESNREVVDIQLKYVDLNPKASMTILMVHGWPSLWSTWSNQIQEFESDYHLLVPDLRGFGESTHPDDVKSSGTMGDMVSDLVCILEAAKVSSAICMGHDWGSAVCYEAARARPDIFVGVVGAAVPYIPAAGPFVPIKQLVSVLPKLMYQIYFDTKTAEAVAELNADIKRTMRATLRTVDSPPPEGFLTSDSNFLKAWDNVDIPPVPFFTPEEEDYYVQEMSIQGFKNTLQFYTTENRYQSWELAHTQGNQTISQPVLAIYPKNDTVADWVFASNLLKSAVFLPKLTTELLEGSHWAHLEHPQKFNKLVRRWLNVHFNTASASHGDEL